MRKNVLIFLMVATCFASISLWGKTLTWTAEGGGNMSAAANWDSGTSRAPISGYGDALVISGCTGPSVITNDIPSLHVASIKNTTPYPVTIAGTCEMQFAIGTDCIYAEGGDLVFDVPVLLTTYGGGTTGRTRISSGLSMTFNNVFSITNMTPGACVTVKFLVSNGGTGQFNFNDVVFAPYADVSNDGQPKATFAKTVDFHSFTWGVYYTGASADFYGAGNRFGLVRPGVYSSVLKFHVPDALTEDTVLGFADTDYLAGSGTWTSGVYDFAGNQVFDRVISDAIKNKDGVAQNIDRIQGTGTLTMRATEAAASHAAWNGGISLVYDPVGPFVYQALGRANEMSGSLIVKGGTFKLAEGATFRNVSAVAVRNAATLAVDASDGVNPFADTIHLEMDEQAKLDLSAGTSVQFARVLRAGVYVRKGTFTGVGHGTDSADEVDWIDGAGTLTVTEPTTCWKGAVDGAWNDPSMWTDGVPTGDKETYFLVSGGDYAVTVPSGVAMPTKLFVGNSGTGRVTLTGDFSFEKSWIEIAAGGRVEVPTGKTFLYSGVDGDGNRTVVATDVCTDESSPIRIHDGGELLVNGGTARIENLAGFLKLAGTDESCGAITVTAGSFGVTANTASDKVFAADGGRVVLSGASTYTGGDLSVFSGASDGRVTFGPGVTASPALSPFMSNKGESTIDLFSSLNGTASWGEEVIFGFVYAGIGHTVYNVSNACVKAGGANLTIAGPRGGYGYAAQDITAAVNVLSGGWMSVSGERKGAFSYAPTGLLVGFGAHGNYKTDTPPHIVGALSVSEDAAVTNFYGHFMVGCGWATGTVSVAGGEIVSGINSPATGNDGTTRSFDIGLWHGVGRFEISDGRLVVGSDAYIGGRVKESFPDSGNWGVIGNKSFLLHDAQGAFVQRGGEVSFAKQFVLGADGTGEIVREGSVGSFVARDIVFSNTVENVVSGGLARFKLDANGVAPLAATGKLTIGANAKLVVDTSAYPVDGRSVTLIRYGEREGEFSSVELTGAFAEKAELRYGPQALRMIAPRGLVLTVR